MNTPTYFDHYATEQWAKYAPNLVSRGDITEQDWHNLECFCVNYSAYREAQEELKKHGLIIVFSNQNRGQNPAFKAMLEAQKLMIKFGEKLGFDPITRAKFTPDLDEHDELDDIIPRVR